jgi:DNA-binding GntR family transcriptional regulator
MRVILTHFAAPVKKKAFTMSSKPVRRAALAGSLAEQVYRHLRGQIILGQYPAGEKLVELELATATGTSQGTVREALQRLEREGLVERQPHRATVVTEINTDEIYELFAVRSTIEGFAVRRAVDYLTDANLQQLAERIEAMRTEGSAGDVIGLVENDLEFHRLICDWSRSKTLLRAWLPLYAQIQRFIAQTHPQYFGDLVRVADSHLPVYDALQRRDADAAVRLMQEHIMLIWSWLDDRSGRTDESAKL